MSLGLTLFHIFLNIFFYKQKTFFIITNCYPRHYPFLLCPYTCLFLIIIFYFDIKNLKPFLNIITYFKPASLFIVGFNNSDIPSKNSTIPAILSQYTEIVTFSFTLLFHIRYTEISPIIIPIIIPENI